MAEPLWITAVEEFAETALVIPFVQVPDETITFPPFAIFISWDTEKPGIDKKRMMIEKYLKNL